MKEEVKEKISKLVELLLALTPISNEIVRILRETEIMKYSEIAEKYEDYFDPKAFSRIAELLGIEVSGGRVSLRYDGIGSFLKNLSGAIELKLSDDEFRKELSEWLEKEIPDPAERYVRLCMESIKEDEKLGLRVLKYLSRYGSYYSAIKEELAKEGISTSEDEIRESLYKISDLGIISIGKDGAAVVGVYEKYIKKLANEYL